MRVIRTAKVDFVVCAAGGPCPLMTVASSLAPHESIFLSADAACTAYSWANIRKVSTTRDGHDPDYTESWARKSERNGYIERRVTGQSVCADYGMCPQATQHFGDEDYFTLRFFFFPGEYGYQAQKPLSTS